jgi:SAM-dependent methyltransferase
MDRDKWGVQRRVAGEHNYRLDGLTDLLSRARGASVLDLGCNRGMVALDFANNGATIVHGIDNAPDCIDVCRGVFADIRNVQSHFEAGDLTQGPASLDPFRGQQYDFVLMLATLHKLRREMSDSRVAELIFYLADRTNGFFAWRGTQAQHRENETELKALDGHLNAGGFKRIHTSHISALGVAAIWERR